MRKYLPFVAIVGAVLLSTIGIYLAFSMLTPGVDEDVEEILVSFKTRSKLCDQPLPTLDSYIAHYGTEKVARWLWNYVKLHREIMCADSPSMPRRYVVYHASAGLGNRMQSLFSTFIFAVLSDRALIVDWRPQPKSHVCYVHDLFDLPDFDWNYKLIRPLLDDAIIDEHSIRVAFDDPMLLDPFMCANLSEYYRAVPVIDIHTDEYYAPMFEHGYYHDSLREVFGDREIFTQVAPFLFRMREEIKRSMEHFEREHFGADGCALGLQVRQDGIGHLDGSKTVHWTCGQQLLEDRSDLSNGKIFLASDVQTTRNEAERIFGERVVFYPVPVRHQVNQTCDEVKAALIDLMLLTRCKALVVTSWSSLGAVAHSIAGVKPVIAMYKPPGANEVSSIKESEGHARNYCNQVDWSRPCFLEWVHVRHLSCFRSDMFADEPCCELGFCKHCLHHESFAVAFLSFYHWPAPKILFTMLLITLTAYGTYRSLLFYCIRRNNYRVFARNASLSVLAVVSLVWLLVVTIVRSEYHKTINQHYIVTW